MEILEDSWCQSQTQENIFQDLNASDCVIVDSMDTCKKLTFVREVIDISDDCDSNASTVIDVADLGSIRDVDSIIQENDSNLVDLTFQSENSDPENKTEDALDQIKISKIESLSKTDENDNKLIPPGNCSGNKIDLKIKQELPILDYQENYSPDPELNLLIASDMIQKYFPYIEFQQIPSLVCNINSEAVDSLEKSDQNPEKKRKKFRCPFCSFADFNKDLLKFHLYRHINDKLICNICNKKFSTKEILVDHIISYIINYHSFAGVTSRQCFVCYGVFSDNYYLNLHVQVHKIDGLFRCNTCCYVVKTPQTFKNHVEKHFIEGLFICDDCGRPFKDKDKLAGHWHRSHSDKTVKYRNMYRFKCEFCEQVFNRKDLLRRHMTTVHEIQD